jgi:putative Holliday junction resolvase
MRTLGIDYGEKRIGLAYGDELGLAVPLAAAVESSVEARLAHIAEEIKRRRIEALVVGYPYNMDGTIGFKAKEVDAFIAVLEARFGLPVHRTDERLTSHQAAGELAQARGRSKRSRGNVARQKAERASGVLDSRAAALLLQDYLDGESGPLLPPEEEA